MWICPKCGRSFKNANQSHSCVLISKDDLFNKRPAFLKSLYKKILAILQGFGDFREEAVPPDVIFFKTRSTFLAVKVKKDHLDIEFFLDHAEDVSPVSKYVQISKNRFAHIVPVDNEKEIDTQLIGWMKHSYDLVNT